MPQKPKLTPELGLNPDYLGALKYAVDTPIELNGSEYPGDNPAPPTPLDPENVFISGWDFRVRGMVDPNFGQDYIHFAVESIVKDVDFLVQSGLLEEVRGSRIKDELVAQVINRTSHNQQAFSRLVGALVDRPATPEMLDVVRKVRCGLASLAEMADLLRSYPEMLSVETSNYRSMASSSDVEKAIDSAWAMADELRKNYVTAEVRVRERDDQDDVAFSLTVQGGLVSKRVLADIMSAYGHSQLVLKVPFIKLDGPIFHKMGATTYLRVRDYASRAGYYAQENQQSVTPDDLNEIVFNLPPEEARQLLGRLAAR